MKTQTTKKSTKAKKPKKKKGDAEGAAEGADARPSRSTATIDAIRPSVELFYDLQKLRIATNNRGGPHADGAEAQLTDEDAAFLSNTGAALKALEKDAEGHIARRIRGIPIYEEWLRKQRGIGPIMAAVIMSSINIELASTPSKMWKYAGIDVMPNGQGRRRVRGEKLGYNPWLKTKLMGVMADNLVRVAVLDESGRYVRMQKGEVTAVYPTEEIWRRFYDQYKHRKQSQRVPTCWACDGCGTVVETSRDQQARQKAVDRFCELSDAAQKERVAKAPCENCGGTGGPAPWGWSDAHRAQAAKRYMIKMFLVELYRVWRALEGLEVRPTYQEEKLGHVHGR